MKIQPVITLFSVAISAILGYIVYSVGDTGNANLALLSILSAVSFWVILFSGIGIQYETTGSNANIKVLSVSTTIVAFIIDMVLSILSSGRNTVILVTAIILVVYLLILYLITKSDI